MNISVVIRTLNEQAYLEELLQGVAVQRLDEGDVVEVVLVDSGSTDNTLEIAGSYGCRIAHIQKEDFTFGRSLNLGCETADGDVLVFISGHCVPASDEWLRELIRPIKDGVVEYCYGRQIGRGTTKFSESRVFLKYFPKDSMLPQLGYFANNANAAVSRAAWLTHGFDESLTGLEDMKLGRDIKAQGGQIGYAAPAAVYHIHDETWSQVRTRYEREAFALASIAPEVAMTLQTFFSCVLRSIAKDSYRALQQKILLRELGGILLFRFNQFYGGYRGNRLAKDVSRAHSRNYFYPDRQYEQEVPGNDNNRPAAYEGPQQPRSW